MRRLDALLACSLSLLVGGAALWLQKEGKAPGTGLLPPSVSNVPAVTTFAPLLDTAKVPAEPTVGDEATGGKTRATLEPFPCGELEKEPPEGPPTRQRGTPKEWRAAYEGLSGFDPREPPALLPLAKAASLPPATLVFARAEALVALALPSGTERVFDPAGARDARPLWSADGQWLFFLSDRQDRERFGERAPWRVTRMRADGSERRAVSGPFCETWTSWAVSPDGGHVAYVAPTFRGATFARATTLRVVDVALDDDRGVEDGEHVTAPTFSKDGLTLLFGRDAATAEGAPHTAIVSFGLASRTKIVYPQRKLVYLDDLHDLGDGRVLFVGDTDRSFCCRDPHPYVLDRRTGVTQAFGRVGAPEGFLHVLPAANAQAFVAAYTRRGVGGAFADLHADVVALDARGTPGRALANDFPRPFYSATDPAFLPDDRHVVMTLALTPWREGGFAESTLVVADLRRPGPLVEIATGSNVAVRPPTAE